MLRKLLVQNYAIIDEVAIQFSNQLTIITGETGAGKSILLGALGLILGQRSSNNILRNKEKKCVIEGTFDITGRKLKSFFEQNDLDYDEETIVRREITPSGKSRSFINDTPVTLQILSQLGEQLINLHAQHQTLYLNNRQYQLLILDNIAGHQQKLEQYQILFKKYKKLQEELEQLRRENQQLNRELDYINFQIDEFEQIQLQNENEQEQLQESLKQLNDAELIQSSLFESAQLLSGESSLSESLLIIEKNLRKLSEYGSQYQQVFERIQSLSIELNDLGNELQTLSEGVESNPQKALQVQERLDLILRLQNKHQVDTVAELMQIYNDLVDKKLKVEGQDVELGELDAKAAKFEKQLRHSALQLSQNRQKAIDVLQKKVNILLGEMNMQNAHLSVVLSLDKMGELGPNGLDEVRFLFASNKGSAAIEIKKVASGGELSRLMLAIQSLLAKSTSLPTMVFDEIDTGISGEVSIRVGKVLRRLSRTHQLICITHLPQIASLGQTHYRIYKEDIQERTVSKVEYLEGENRVVEIGTILSGEPPSEQAKANARELMIMMNE